jgi:hypothetical protein
MRATASTESGWTPLSRPEAAPPPFEPFLPAREITRSPLSPRRDTARDAQREDVTTAGDDLPEADASLPGSAAAARVASARAADAGDSTVASDRAGRAEANIAVARGSVACGVRRRRLSAFYPYVRERRDETTRVSRRFMF